MVSRNAKLVLVALLAVPFLWVSWVEFSFLILRPGGQPYPVVSEWLNLAIQCLFIAAGSLAILVLQNLQAWFRGLLVVAYAYNMWWLLDLVTVSVAYLMGVFV